MKKLLILLIFIITISSCKKQPVEPIKQDTFKATLILEGISPSDGTLTVFALYDATLNGKDFKFPNVPSNNITNDNQSVNIVNGSVLDIKNLKPSVDSTFVRIIYPNTNKVITLFRCKGTAHKLILKLLKP